MLFFINILSSIHGFSFLFLVDSCPKKYLLFFTQISPYLTKKKKLLQFTYQLVFTNKLHQFFCFHYSESFHRKRIIKNILFRFWSKLFFFIRIFRSLSFFHSIFFSKSQSFHLFHFLIIPVQTCLIFIPFLLKTNSNENVWPT